MKNGFWGAKKVCKNSPNLRDQNYKHCYKGKVSILSAFRGDTIIANTPKRAVNLAKSFSSKGGGQ